MLWQHIHVLSESGQFMAIFLTNFAHKVTTYNDYVSKFDYKTKF